MVGTTLVPHSYIANGQRLQKIPPPFPLDLVFTIVPCCRRETHTVQKLDKVPICIYIFTYVLFDHGFRPPLAVTSVLYCQTPKNPPPPFHLFLCLQSYHAVEERPTLFKC